MKALASLLIILLVWIVASSLSGAAIFPGPLATAKEMLLLLSEWSSWENIFITFFRGTSGLLLAFVLALLTGVPCGSRAGLMQIISPIVAAVQACPTIVWVSLLMVWVGTGSIVSITAVVVALYPIMFLNIAQGVASLDKRLISMSRLYHVPKIKMISGIILPGIAPFLLAAMAYALSTTWKITTTAEFIGSGSGIGAKIFWAFRMLNMPRLFCWALLLIAFGVFTDGVLVKALRNKVAHMKESKHA